MASRNASRAARGDALVVLKFRGRRRADAWQPDTGALGATLVEQGRGLPFS